jgi:hypothetical protein
MAIQTINVGNLANDGTGDDLREAFIKVNQNFAELELQDTTAKNVGIGGFTVFKESVAGELKFRAMQPDPTAPGSVTFRISDDGDTLFLKSTQAQLIFTDETNTLTSNIAEPIIFKGAPNSATQVSVSNATKTVTIDSQLSRESSPAVSGTLNMQNNNIQNCGTINGVVVSSLSDIASLDFGGISNNVTSILEYILQVGQDVDLGTITSPVQVTIDEGLIAS